MPTPWETLELDSGQTHLVIPKWFLTLSAIGLTIVTATFVPWAIWQTRVVMRLEVQMEILAAVDPSAPIQNQREILRLQKLLDEATEDRFRRREFRQWVQSLKARNPELMVPEVVD